jgi:hypothetical protein
MSRLPPIPSNESPLEALRAWQAVCAAKGGTLAYFKKAAAAFAKDPSAMNWRDLKRAMMYHQRATDPNSVEFVRGLETFSIYA